MRWRRARRLSCSARYKRFMEFLSPRLKREVSAYDSASGQKLLANYVCAEMHVVMAVNPPGGGAIQALKLLQLRAGDVFK